MKEEQVLQISLSKTRQRNSDNEPKVDSDQCTVQLIHNMLNYQKNTTHSQHVGYDRGLYNASKLEC